MNHKRKLHIGALVFIMMAAIWSTSSLALTVQAESFSSIQNKPKRVATLLASSISYDTVQINWLGQNVDGYSIYRSTTQEEEDYQLIDEVAGTAISYVDTGLKMGTRYYYRVSAYNLSDTGVRNTGDLSIALTAIPVLGSTDKVSAKSIDYSTIRLSWTQVIGADGYIIYQAEHGSKDYKKIKVVKGADTCTYKVKNLVTAKEYDYKIQTWKNDDGDIAYSAKSDVLTAAAQLSLVKSTAANATAYDTIDLSWDSVKGADGYIVLRSTAKDGTYKKVKTVKDTSYTDTGLDTGTTYYYQIQAYRKVEGEKVLGKASEVCSAKPILDIVENVTADGTDYQTVSLNWDATTGANGYIILRALAAEDMDISDSTVLEGLTYEEVARTEELTYEDTGLVTAQNYVYQIQAYRTVNNKEITAKVSIPVVISTQLDKAQISKITKQNSSSIALTLIKVEGADGYHIYRSTSADGEYTLIKDYTDISGDNLEYTDTGLNSNTTYYYQVEAYCNIRVGAVANTESVDANTEVDAEDVQSDNNQSDEGTGTEDITVVTGEMSKTSHAKTAKIKYSGSSYKFSSDTSNKIVKLAASKLGCSYVWGAAGPNKFDCSGLVVWVYKKAGCTKSIPHHAQSIYNKFTHVSRSDLQEGDLVFYGGSTGSITHVAIYVGGGKVIHAANPSSGVKVSALSSAGGGKVVGYAHISF